MKGSRVIQEILDRPGPTPRLSDSEVVTMALYQELIGEPRQDHFFRLHQEQLRGYFPGLNERSRYNRRKRDLWSVILAVRMSLQIVLDALLLEETAVIDSAPVPCVGYKRGKQVVNAPKCRSGSLLVMPTCYLCINPSYYREKRLL